MKTCNPSLKTITCEKIIGPCARTTLFNYQNINTVKFQIYPIIYENSFSYLAYFKMKRKCAKFKTFIHGNYDIYIIQ